MRFGMTPGVGNGADGRGFLVGEVSARRAGSNRPSPTAAGGRSEPAPRAAWYTASAQSRKCSSMVSSIPGPPAPWKYGPSTQQRIQASTGARTEISTKSTHSSVVSVRLISTFHPGLSNVPIFIPKLCSQSPLHRDWYHLCNRASVFMPYIRLPSALPLTPGSRWSAPGRCRSRSPPGRASPAARTHKRPCLPGTPRPGCRSAG